MRAFSVRRLPQTALPVFGLFGLLTGFDMTLAGREDRARAVARAALAAARARKPPVWTGIVFDSARELAAAAAGDAKNDHMSTYRMRPGDKIGDVEIPTGVWTTEALVAEVNTRSRIMLARALDATTVGFAPLEDA